jgi:selenide, water dikinase
VLIGGGHTHAIALKQLAQLRSQSNLFRSTRRWLSGDDRCGEFLAGVRLSLITEAPASFYSGMLPGLVAGFYPEADCQIDIIPLAQSAMAQLTLDQAIRVDLSAKQVFCAHHPPLSFDWLSINIGSTPTLPPSLRCAETTRLDSCSAELTLEPDLAEPLVIPAKPIPVLLQHWQRLVDRVAAQPDRPWRLVIVGGGAGGVELALAMQHRLHQIFRLARQPLNHLELHLIHRGPTLLPQHNTWVRDRFQKLLSQRQIRLHLGQTVETVDIMAAPAHDPTGGADQPSSLRQLRCTSGLTLSSDAVIWVTQASAPTWLREAGLATDEHGFVWVGDTLQSISHPFVFAAGDVATMVNHPRPKAGVFAVRQAAPLVQNLCRAAQGQPLLPYHPQSRYLSLIGTADGQAVASWGRWGWRSPLLWRWKEAIDRGFVAQFKNSALPED